MTNFTGADFKDWVLIVAGNIFTVILVTRMIGYYAKKEWGELVGHLIVAVLIVGFIYFNPVAIGLLKSLWTMFTGGTATP